MKRRKPTLSRQSLWQRKHKRLGLCMSCSEHAAGDGYCVRHMVKRREAQRRLMGYKRRNDSLSRRLEAKVDLAVGKDYTVKAEVIKLRGGKFKILSVKGVK